MMAIARNTAQYRNTTPVVRRRVVAREAAGSLARVLSSVRAVPEHGSAVQPVSLCISISNELIRCDGAI
jgi:hypothetical protein